MQMRVLLVHGLGRTALSMRPLARVLRREGHEPTYFGYVAGLEQTERTLNGIKLMMSIIPAEPTYFGYVAFAESYDQIVQRLRIRIGELAVQGPYAIVGHSLGGVLVRAALGGTSISAPCRVIMLGTPNQRSRMAEWALRFAPWRWFVGNAGRKLADPAFYRTLPQLRAPCTVVAGTRGPRADWLPLGARVNDGLVAVDETALHPDDPIIAVPAGHSFMMNRRSVQRAVVEALADCVSA